MPTCLDICIRYRVDPRNTLARAVETSKDKPENVVRAVEGTLPVSRETGRPLPWAARLRKAYYGAVLDGLCERERMKSDLRPGLAPGSADRGIPRGPVDCPGPEA